MSAQRLESKRLLLLPWESADWIAFKPIATDPAVMRYISKGRPWTDEKIREFVERQQRHYREVGYCLWKLIRKSEGRLVGFCGLQPLDDLPGVEIGWWLAQDQWGQGLATEAARVAAKDGFERIGLNKIVAVALPENRAPIHVMEKLGMRCEGEAKHHGFAVVLYVLEKQT
ncbi:MAG TPA: GNAT family N-acetyltransferase [Methylomirabilota bacterium]|nr:GNAT family N-acetyltransferase [Methylomirabilota bacterium]